MSLKGWLLRKVSIDTGGLPPEFVWWRDFAFLAGGLRLEGEESSLARDDRGGEGVQLVSSMAASRDENCNGCFDSAA